MMEYKGYRTVVSEKYGENVHIMKYAGEEKFPYIECSRCGKLIKRTMYVIQNTETDVEMEYLGSDCIKHFK